MKFFEKARKIKIIFVKYSYIVNNDNFFIADLPTYEESEQTVKAMVNNDIAYTPKAPEYNKTKKPLD